MIRLIEDKSYVTAVSDVCAVRIRAYLDSYGLDNNFLLCWCQFDEKDNETAVILKVDSSVTISLTDNADTKEISEFLTAVGFSEVFCNKKIGNISNSCNTAGLYVYDYKETDKSEICQKNSENIDFKKLYDFLKINGDGAFHLPSFDAFFVDLSHKIRHNTARVNLIEINEEIVSAVIVSAECSDVAIISGVATKATYRKKGFAKRLVCSCLNELVQDKKIFVCANEKVGAFYLKCGFKKLSEVYFYK